MKTKCLPSDIGLHIRLHDQKILCFVKKDFVDFQNIVVIDSEERDRPYELVYHADCKADDAYDNARKSYQNWKKKPIAEKLKKTNPLKNHESKHQGALNTTDPHKSNS